MPVCIAGMHRSGTSMVTKLLHLCGLYLGHEDEMLSKNSHNADGYWEHKRFVEINDSLLSELGGGWDYPPQMPAQWELGENLAALKAKAEALVNEFAGKEPWGWKDPRNSLTLPFWNNLLPEMKVIICLRNPLEVTVSLRRRGWSSYSLGLALWKTYNQILLESVPAKNRIITNYESYFSDPKKELRRILNFIDIPSSDEVLDQAIGSARIALRHNRLTPKHLLDFNVSPEIFSLYMQMCDEAGSKNQIELSNSEFNVELGEAAGTPFAGAKEKQVDEIALDIQLLRNELERLRPGLESRDKKILELDTTVKERTNQVKQITKEITQRDNIINELQEKLTQRDGFIEEIKAGFRDINELRRLLEEQANQFNMLAEEGRKREALLRHNEGLLIEASRERDELRHQNEELFETVYKIQEEVSELEKSIARQDNVEQRDRRNYTQLVRIIREAVNSSLPENATVAVVSKGDEMLLKLKGRKGWHFPRSESGDYAGYYPADGSAVVAHLEALRAEGADYILFPWTAHWWLDHYPKFKKYLETKYQTVVNKEGVCSIYALKEPASVTECSWQSKVEQLVEKCEESLNEVPSILDWNSGLDWRANFPHLSVFSPPLPGSVLPYLDRSIDVVAVSSTDPNARDEALRVANMAVLTVTDDELDDGGGSSLQVNWQLDLARTETSVSIIIPLVNSNAAGQTGLSSLRETLNADFTGEVIVIADPLQAERLGLEDLGATVKILKESKRVSFWENCNRGAKAATGDVLIFLDPRVIPLAGWLLPMAQIFRDYPDAGVVGGKHLFSDGRLFQAGGKLLDDMSLEHVGGGDYHPDAPEYNFVRKVDHCLAAFLATKRDLFDELGGFDARFTSNSHPNVEYCLKVKAKGSRVYYQPASVFVHLGGPAAAAAAAPEKLSVNGNGSSRSAAHSSLPLKTEGSKAMAASEFAGSNPQDRPAAADEFTGVAKTDE